MLCPNPVPVAWLSPRLPEPHEIVLQISGTSLDSGEKGPTPPWGPGTVGNGQTGLDIEKRASRKKHSSTYFLGSFIFSITGIAFPAIVTNIVTGGYEFEPDTRGIRLIL